MSSADTKNDQLEHYYLRIMREEVALSGEVGTEEAAKQTAKKLLEYADLPAVKYKAGILKEKIDLKKRKDAKAALELLKAAVRQYGKEAERAFSSNVIEESAERVTIKVLGTCPMLIACDSDLELCEKLCRANEGCDILTNPEFILLTKEVNPGLKWKIKKFRGSVDEPCEYVIELAGSISKK